ncbi:hypothetical protein GCM10010446_60060 [Streptomyces enissocaesilis]|uniref:ABC transporter domain-containing protein n=1 Tax=Streptomyces enissocaesilis TaxID=332589 RepID=A0ABN3XLH5_9ACTN
MLPARTGADEAELYGALKAVDMAAWVRGLEDGPDTEVGRGALSLTPAQGQQVALARLILADPHILVLDEAASMLDPGAARHLERSPARMLEGRTVIAVAHRPQTACDSDLIAVVEHGRTTEAGAHRRLIAADGPCAELWRSWHGGDGERSRA